MGKNVCDYIQHLDCSNHLINVMTVEHRSNNKKRDFLFCNKEQGKHIPVSPSIAFDLFDELTHLVNSQLKRRKVLVIGFAETATAIGAYLASKFDSCVYHLQTTRENCEPVKKLIEFSEEHSHATEQYLYGDLENIPYFDYVLFVEDEISTGKTILNFIREFKKINHDLLFGVASICNWQNEANREIYKEHNIDTFSLIKGELKDENVKMDVTVKPEVTQYAGKEMYSFTQYCSYETVYMKENNPFLVERTGRVPGNKEYENILEESFNKVFEFIGKAQDILIIGTEEFMYFPMLVGEMLEGFGRRVHTHSTTRSSIDIIEGSSDIYNGIVNKNKLHSAYDANRDTYIYNLRKYDKVIIITDADMTDEFRFDITSALAMNGNGERDTMFLSIKQ